ncbi:MAG: type II toxin-antitoxin system VapC family toxin [Acidobacteriaceae bacterium]
MSAKAPDPSRALLLLDTHVLLWATLNEPRLGRQAAKSINLASRQDRLSVSAITPWEIALLESKGRITLQKDVLEWIRDALAKPGISLVPLEPEIAVSSTRLPFEMHADPANRILVATARHLGATLVTADKGLLDLAKKDYFLAIDAGK